MNGKIPEIIPTAFVSDFFILSVFTSTENFIFFNKNTQHLEKE